MKNVEFKELFNLWKETIIDTSLFIAKLIVVSVKWLYSEFKTFYAGGTWITWTVMAFLGIFIINTIRLESKHSHETIRYCKQIDSLQNCVDSIDVESKTAIMLMKAGEYHITPHNTSASITKDSVASLLKQLNAWYPDIIMAQIQAESCYGTSNVAINSNNILGMKKTNKRKTTQIKNQDYRGYGKYNNWESCVIDRVIWDYEMFGNKKPSRDTYINHLNSCYAESREYGNVMDSHSKRYLKYL
jgi:hypothetical protein